MAIRALMTVVGAFRKEHGGGCKVIFEALYDDDTPEDRKFAKFTPTGEASFEIDNPAVMDQIVIGRKYYFDITEMPAPVDEDAGDTPEG